MAENHAHNALDEARAEIDDVDREMAELFARRMRAVESIASFKAERGLPIYNPEREAEVLERNAALVDDELRPYYLRFMESVMDQSRQYQCQLIEEKG